MRPIVLIGLPGSGKSTVGVELSRRLGWKFTDLDAEIERETGRTIAKIFKDDGEARFRDLETSLLEKTLTAAAQQVVATGGGIVEREQNRKLLKLRSQTVYLELPVAEAAARVRADEAKALSAARPLFTGAADLAEVTERLIALLNRREPFYRSADVVVPSGERSVDEVVAEIESAIKSLSRT